MIFVPLSPLLRQLNQFCQRALKGCDCEAPIVRVILKRTKALLAQLSADHNCAAPIFLSEWNNALRWTHLWLILAGALAETLE